jgi:hypothetical protein
MAGFIVFSVWAFGKTEQFASLFCGWDTVQGQLGWSGTVGWKWPSIGFYLLLGLKMMGMPAGEMEPWS